MRSSRIRRCREASSESIGKQDLRVEFSIHNRGHIEYAVTFGKVPSGRSSPFRLKSGIQTWLVAAAVRHKEVPYFEFERVISCISPHVNGQYEHSEHLQRG